MHPLAPKHVSHPSVFQPYTGDGSSSSIAEWSKQITAKETVVRDGKRIDVFNLRQRFSILSPSYGFQVTEHYFGSYLACQQATAHYRMPDGSIERLPIIADRINVPNDSHIDRARNTITNIWVDQDLTDLCYWWDVDIPLHPEFLMLIFCHLQDGVDFVCGHYAMKDIIPTFVANIAGKPAADSQLHELLDGGTGSMAWHRRVPLKLRHHTEVTPYLCAPNSPFAGKIHFAYFSSGTYGAGVPATDLTPDQKATLQAASKPIAPLQQWLSEDWKVCRLWQELGGKVYGDRRIKLQHFGGLLYPPTVESLSLATQAMIKGNHPAVQADKLRALLAAYKDPTPPRDPAAIAPVIPISEAKAA